MRRGIRASGGVKPAGSAAGGERGGRRGSGHCKRTPSVRDSVDSTSYHDILDVWLFEYDGEAHLSRALTDEVAQTRWLSPVQIRELYTAHQLVGTLSYFFENVEGLSNP